MAVAVLLAATLSALGPQDAGAQVFGGTDCIHPANAVYTDVNGPYSFTCAVSLSPPIYCTYNISGVQLSGFGSCSPPPLSVPGSAVAIDLTGSMSFDLDESCVCGNPCDSPARVTSGTVEPVYGTMFVSFNHQEGVTRYFDTTVANLSSYLPDLGSVSFPLGVGQLTIDDLGDGNFRIAGYFDIDLAVCGGAGANHFVLTSPTTDVPRGQEVRSLTLAPTVPSPVRSRARIRFTLPAEGPVTLRIYDLAGREVASLLDGKVMPAGVHEMDVDAQGWRPGCYYFRLAAEGGSRTQMMVVVQ